MMTEMPVFVVDDDETVRDCLKNLLRSVGLEARLFPSAVEFLASYDGNPLGCLVLDVRMPQMSGLALQDELVARGIAIPIIFLSGHADVAMAVAAMKKGAFDFIAKPFNPQQLLDSVHRALDQARRIADRAAELAQFKARLALLSPREQEVLVRVRQKQNVKLIALEMGLSRKTVDTHLASIRRKLEIGHLSDIPGMPQE